MKRFLVIIKQQPLNLFAAGNEEVPVSVQDNHIRVGKNCSILRAISTLLICSNYILSKLSKEVVEKKRTMTDLVVTAVVWLLCFSSPQPNHSPSTSVTLFLQALL